MLKIIAAIIALSAPANALVIRDDLGGQLIPYAMNVAAQQGRVEIAGVCASACTLWLKRACIRDNARLGFHGPHSTGKPLSRAEFDRLSLFMANFYPPKIAAWFMLEGRFIDHKNALWLTADQAVAMGATRC